MVNWQVKGLFHFSARVNVGMVIYTFSHERRVENRV